MKPRTSGTSRNTGSVFKLLHWYLYGIARAPRMQSHPTHRARQDEERIEYFDKLHSQDEERYVILGCVQGILYVVYTMRDECARLISARMATPFERRIYYGEE